MPFFCVMMLGQNISVPVADSDNDAIGFYTTRWVKAATPEEAETIATEMVMIDWTESEYAEMNRGDPPQLSVEMISYVGLLKYLWRRPGGGYGFYSSE